MSLLFFGRSHLTCIEEAFASGAIADAPGCRFFYLQDFAVQDHAPEPTQRGRPPPKPMQTGQGTQVVDNYDLPRIRSIISASPEDMVCLSIHGNEHFTSSVLDVGLAAGEILSLVEERVKTLSFPWLKFFSGLHPRVVLIPPPPPVEASLILLHRSKLRANVAKRGVSPAELRLGAWKHQIGLLRARAAEVGIEFLELPQTIHSDSGLLRPEFTADDPTHGNRKLGALLLNGLLQKAAESPAAPPVLARATTVAPAQEKSHPYKGLPDAAFWRESVASIPVASLDPVRQVPFGIGKEDKVATAGSCFAQHISKRLRKGGFHFLITEEPASSADDAQARGFYDFSARYGNIYTSRQLVQLFDRAFGFFTPLEEHWALDGGRFCDPFRPRIEPEGFASLEALRQDRQRHLQAVRRMFEELDVFVFTLGLTECWISKLDGAAYPLAPGVSGGQFDAGRYAFVNLTVEEIVKDLQAFIGRLRLVNPKARMILTVSPVPLAATYSEEHVLVATTYSKSVLRVAAEMIERANEGVLYFPSYEIITGAHARGSYFAEDLRSVTEAGVSHVMQVFMNRMITGSQPASQQRSARIDEELSEIEVLAEAVCDEALLARR